MTTVQCANNHFYDDARFTSCPHCGVPGLRDAKVPGTQAASISRPGVPRTEAASPPGVDPQVREGGGFGRGGTPGVTVGVIRKQTGIDPVVGWIVCVDGVNRGREYRLHSDRNTIGRAPNMDVCIEGDETISRENHCQIVFSRRNKIFSVVPGLGRNIIYLNGNDVLAATVLEPYDRLEFGEGSFLFVPFVTEKFDWGFPQPPKPRRSGQVPEPPPDPDDPLSYERDPG